MFAFALAVGGGDPSAAAARVRSMMDAFPARARDGTRIVEASRAAAGVSRWAVVRRDEAAAPSWDERLGLLFAGDVRLYNRRELVAELGLPASLDGGSDLELARQAYLRWGEAAPGHLIGDFAFAAWDQGRRALFAARDHFGVRPLVYRAWGDGVAVASDVRQLLALAESPFDDVDHEHILDRLTGTARDLHRTCFRAINRLPPGHRLAWGGGAGGFREARYWLPPAPPDRPASYDDNCARLRELFERAVRDRLDSDRPLVAHSSGGFDSSTIVMAADAIYRAEPGRPPLVLASAVAPGYPSDESHYMDAVARRATFEGTRWNAVADGPLAFHGVAGAAPVLRRGPSRGSPRDLETARERDAGVLISGVMGDDLLHGTGVLRDLVRHGRLARAAQEVTALRLSPTAGKLRQRLRGLVDAGMGVLPPTLALEAWRRLTARAPQRPHWLGPSLAGLWPPRREVLDLSGAAWHSHVACNVWARLTCAQAGYVVEGRVEPGTEEGVEVRAPFADVRLAEHMLRIPWEQREPHGHNRRTGRDALGPLLPPEFATRLGQRPWTEVWLANALATVPAVAPFIEEGPWLSAPFVDRRAARAMLDAVRAGGRAAPPESCLMVPRIGTLEAWLRSLRGAPI
jgi:asparagine synthase (glutamine-hydrolysing)